MNWENKKTAYPNLNDLAYTLHHMSNQFLLSMPLFESSNQFTFYR